MPNKAAIFNRTLCSICEIFEIDGLPEKSDSLKQTLREVKEQLVNQEYLESQYSDSGSTMETFQANLAKMLGLKDVEMNKSIQGLTKVDMYVPEHDLVI